jgi:hypothetical protein
MPVIDPYGLFQGQRLAACSDMAQLYWPRLYCAANNCARLELHLSSIISQCFRSFNNPPTESAIWSIFDEYAHNYLALVYRADGRLWVQFMTEEKYLKRHKSQDDQRSPAPPQRDLDEYKNRYREWKKRQAQAEPVQSFENLSEIFQNSFPNFSTEVCQGIGDGDGIGDGVRCLEEGEGNTLTSATASTKVSLDVFSSKSLAISSSSPTDEEVLAAREAHLSSAQRKQRALLRATVRRVFAYYIEQTGRNVKLYTLTPTRMDKGMARLDDLLRKANGDLPKAENAMKLVVDALCASGFHNGKNDQHKQYTDWTAHLFKSTDKLEWWLNQ